DGFVPTGTRAAAVGVGRAAVQASVRAGESILDTRDEGVDDGFDCGRVAGRPAVALFLELRERVGKLRLALGALLRVDRLVGRRSVRFERALALRLLDGRFDLPGGTLLLREARRRNQDYQQHGREEHAS